MDSFAKEMRLPFNVRLQNAHVVSKEQINCLVLKTGPTRKRLNSSYANRSTSEYLNELGYTISNFSRIVPEGLLIFFPSYTVMNKSIEFWNTKSGNAKITAWERMAQYKELLVEPRSSSEFGAIIRNFEMKAKIGNGAIFFAVCRGKASEGIDFSDHCARAVIITGMPFPPIFDPKIRLKREYLDKNCRDHMRVVVNARNGNGNGKDHRSEVSITTSTNTGGLNGNTWYMQQAARAVNQALGRVIRHKFDYGAIVLADDRFAKTQQRNALSKRVRPIVTVPESFGEATKSMNNFFRRAKATPEWNRTKEKKKDESSSSSSSSSRGEQSMASVEDDQFMSELAGLPSTAAAALAMNPRANNHAPLRSPLKISNQKKKVVSLFDNLQQNNVHAAMSTSFDNNKEDNEEFAHISSKKMTSKRQMIPLGRTEADKLADLLTKDAQSSSKPFLHPQDSNILRMKQEEKRKKRQQEKLARLKGVRSSSTTSSSPSSHSSSSSSSSSSLFSSSISSSSSSSSAVSQPPPAVNTTSNGSSVPPNPSVNKKRKRSSTSLITTVRETMSKSEFKSFKKFLVELTTLQKLLSKTMNAPTEEQRRESDQILRGLVRMMSSLEEEKKRTLILGLYPMVKNIHLKTRYRQIAALHDVLVPVL